MNKKILLIFTILLPISISDEVILKINKSKHHYDQTGDLTPLIVSISSEDKTEKIKNLDLICIVDVSSSMSGNKIQLVKDSLKYIVNKLMKEEDRLAIVTFNSNANVIIGLTYMNTNNKNTVINKIDNLRASGGTNIYKGLSSSLELITSNYISEQRTASMILLSDGDDNYSGVDTNFKKLIISSGKKDYIFTLHTFGYGQGHNADIMYKLSLIRDGRYFYIEQLSLVQDYFLKIYGMLSTVNEVNVKLTIKSNFQINKIYGMEDMYEYSLKGEPPATFQTTILHFIYGKTYSFVTMVNIPNSTLLGTEVLNATISVFNKSANYLWDEVYNPPSYEEYIKCISFTYFENSYKNGQTKGISIINDGLKWIKSNYDGIVNWPNEYNDVLNYLNNWSYGSANLLFKIRNLKSSISTINGYDDNSYQRKIIDESYNIDVSSLTTNLIKVETTINFDTNKNYYYFYLKDGIGEINGLHFSENRSSIVVYSNDKTYPIKIKPISKTLEYYIWYEQKTRLQTIVEFSRGGKFIYKKDFPFYFYSRIDGKKDITFNIQLLNLEYCGTSENPNHLFDIKAYIIDEYKIDYLNKNINAQPSSTVFKGYFDIGFRVG